MFRLTAIGLVFFVCACVDEERQTADLIIANGVVIHPDGEADPVIEDVVIKDGVIIAVGANLAENFHATQLHDASGRFVIPGLADMHSHFGNGIVDGDADDAAYVLARHLYFGNTTILNLGSFQASPDRIDDLRAKMAAGELAGPRLLAVGALITMRGSHPTTTIYSPDVQRQIAERVARAPASGPIDLSPLRATTLVSTPEDVVTEINRVGSWGADAIKITVESGPSEFGDDHPQMPPAMIKSAVLTAKDYGAPVLCHISSLDEVEDCLANGARGVVHAWTPEAHETGPDDLEQRMAEAGFVVIPTAAMFDGWRRYTADPSLLERAALAGVLSNRERAWLSSPGMIANFGGSPEWDKSIERMTAHLKKFHDLGGTIIAGTDTGNPYRIAGLALHEEIAFYTEAVGLTPREAIAAATIDAARLVDAEGEWGAVRPGRAADLVILNRNPLEDINNTLEIADVVKAGRIVDRSKLPLH